MKTEMLLLDLAMVGFVFIPYVVLIMVGRRNAKMIKKSFLKEARTRGLNFDEIDSWNQNMIGIDKTQRKLLFVQKQPGTISIQVADLKEAREIQLLLERAPGKVNGKVSDVLHKTSLQICQTSGKVIDQIRLYDVNLIYSQEYELKHAEKWHGLIKNLLHLKPQAQTAA